MFSVGARCCDLRWQRLCWTRTWLFLDALHLTWASYYCQGIISWQLFLFSGPFKKRYRQQQTGVIEGRWLPHRMESSFLKALSYWYRNSTATQTHLSQKYPVSSRKVRNFKSLQTLKIAAVPGFPKPNSPILLLYDWRLGQTLLLGSEDIEKY